jgi:acyl-CoA reductase-like NAD-dependent aldehyde dehydrogenase
LLRLHRDDIKQVIQDEIHCTEGWAEINVSASISMIEETAALVTSGSMGGVIPHTETDGSYGFVFARPLGVVLGIAPWNSPLILGFRAVLAPVAAGNTAILKVWRQIEHKMSHRKHR